MNKAIVFVLGVCTGVLLTYIFFRYDNNPGASGIKGLEMYEEPAEIMEISSIEIKKVKKDGCAIGETYMPGSGHVKVLLLPEDGQNFYDGQDIDLERDQFARRVGTYKFGNMFDDKETLPVVKVYKEKPVMTYFDNHQEYVDQGNFKVVEVLESGDAMANVNGSLVLIPADNGNSYYYGQILKAPKGKSAKRIGTYKYYSRGFKREIPIIAFE